MNPEITGGGAQNYRNYPEIEFEITNLVDLPSEKISSESEGLSYLQCVPYSKPLVTEIVDIEYLEIKEEKPEVIIIDNRQTIELIPVVVNALVTLVEATVKGILSLGIVIVQSIFYIVYALVEMLVSMIRRHSKSVSMYEDIPSRHKSKVNVEVNVEGDADVNVKVNVK